MSESTSRSREAEAIERYNAGAAAAPPFAAVRWPHLALDAPNLWRLVEGVLGERVDLAREAFGADLDSDALADRIELAWREDALHVRYAPEGLYVRARCSVRLWWLQDDDEGDEPAEETLGCEMELCLSFSTRRHARPFVDFMSGRIVRVSDGVSRPIDPFGLMVEPELAVAWRLNARGT